MKKVVEHLPVLSDWPQCGVRWSNLMFEESEAMISTMEALREIDVVALPVNDSLIAVSYTHLTLPTILLV